MLEPRATGRWSRRLATTAAPQRDRRARRSGRSRAGGRGPPDNPFHWGHQYVNPLLESRVQAEAATADASVAARCRPCEHRDLLVWIDSIGAIRGSGGGMGSRAPRRRAGPEGLSPRGVHHGRLRSAGPRLQRTGLQRRTARPGRRARPYKSDYVDPIVAILSQRSTPGCGSGDDRAGFPGPTS